MKSPITTHVLDTSLGRPAADVPVVLALREASGSWQELAHGATDVDGRIADLLDESLGRGVYRLTFDVHGYFQRQQQSAFYPEVSVVFEVDDPDQHYHVPLLLSPFGYSTYRGS